MPDYEKLGAFFLGKVYDGKKDALTNELLLYDSRDLTTHAVIVGMTGSGKTGLGLVLLEEAAIDGVPSIAIDPKGDLGNLLLTFPELRPSDFRPWIDEGEASRQAITPDVLAERTAQAWRKGIGEWGQDSARIARFKGAADTAIYTPGATSGLPISILRSFSAPPKALLEDSDALRDRILFAVAGLLSLMGVDADPVQSREQILLSQIFDLSWRAEKSLDLAGLIHQIQSPPFERVGVVDLESFFPAKDRHALAMRLNNLLASPGFSAWLEGEPLDVQNLLYTAKGEPRLSVVSIAHLSDAERMFFLTLLLNEVVAWVRTQPGTSSLRALLYMDEIFGYFPPSAAPPSKGPMLTLLKQARAFGLGIVLATQNPVDLDYKGLANAGTWLIGRIQTERDKARLIDGLEGASGGGAWNRSELEKTLSSLGKRVFLMHNVHEDAPVLFQTRWTLSYMKGPLTRSQIQSLMEGRRALSPESLGVGPQRHTQGARIAAPSTVVMGIQEGERPIVPPQVREGFLPCRASLPEDARIVYRPALLSIAKLHYASAKAGLDHWETVVLLADVPGSPEPIGRGGGAPRHEPDVASAVWDGAATLSAEPKLDKAPATGARFARLPGVAAQPKSYNAWTEDFEAYLVRERTLTLHQSAALKETSRPGEREADFRIRMSQKAREQRDAAIEKLRGQYGLKIARLDDQIRRAEVRVSREEAQYGQRQVESAISIGSTVLGALFGRKLRSVANVSRVGAAARSVGRAAQDKADVGRAQEQEGALKEKRADLEKELQAEETLIQQEWDAARLPLEDTVIRPSKTDASVRVTLAWAPWRVTENGIREAAFE